MVMENEYTTISILKTDKDRFAHACLTRAAEQGKSIPHKEFMTFLLVLTLSYRSIKQCSDVSTSE